MRPSRLALAALVLSLALPVAASAQDCTPTATPTATPSATATPTATVTPEPPADVFYVSPTGSDSSPGTEAAPWRTLPFAFSQLDPGETLRVRGGVEPSDSTAARTRPADYVGDLVYTRVGTADRPITIENYPGETPILEPATREPLRVKGDAAYTTFRGLAIQRAFPASKYQNVYVLERANHVRFERGLIRWARHGSGIFVDNTTSAIDLVGNRVYENNEAGVQHQGIYHEGSGSVIARNVVYGHTNGFGIQVKTGADNIQVSQNTVADNSLSGILVMDTADHVHVVNNISAFNGGYGVRSLNDSSAAPADSDTPSYTDCANISGGCQNVVEGNLLFGNGSSPACASSQSNPPRISCGVQLASADPLFVDRTARDYRVRAGSLAIDAAMDPWTYLPDAAGALSELGTQADVGAYER